MKVVNSNQGKGKPSGIRRLYRHNFSASGRSKPRSPLSMHLGMPRMAVVTTWQGAVSWAGSIQGRRLSLGIDTATQPKGIKTLRTHPQSSLNTPKSILIPT
ncbi:unnamed protein product [Aspergillus oryzae]|nr:unnamed protein product [Aspergillus oryzae]